MLCKNFVICIFVFIENSWLEIEKVPKVFESNQSLKLSENCDWQIGLSVHTLAH